MKTFAVIGQARGGTSAVAGICRLLGLKMYGVDKTSDDYNLFNTFTRQGRDALIAERNQAGDWGFKHPYFWRFKDELPHAFENLHYIFVFRDPVAVNMHFNDNIYPELLVPSLQEYLDYLNVKAGEKAIYISYEKLINQPEKQVKKIAEFLGLPYNKDVLDFLNHVKGYQNVSEFGVKSTA